MAHANARTNVFARRLIVERVAAGWPAALVLSGASRDSLGPTDWRLAFSDTQSVSHRYIVVPDSIITTALLSMLVDASSRALRRRLRIETLPTRLSEAPSETLSRVIGEGRLQCKA